jgi:hypothetical protein
VLHGCQGGSHKTAYDTPAMAHSSVQDPPGIARPQQGEGRLEEKRVSNAALKGQLGVRLTYPTYREGLAAIAAGDLRPFLAEDLRLLGTFPVADEQRAHSH